MKTKVNGVSGAVRTPSFGKKYCTRTHMSVLHYWLGAHTRIHICYMSVSALGRTSYQPHPPALFSNEYFIIKPNNHKTLPSRRKLLRFFLVLGDPLQYAPGFEFAMILLLNIHFLSLSFPHQVRPRFGGSTKNPHKLFEPRFKVATWHIFSTTPKNLVSPLFSATNAVGVIPSCSSRNDCFYLNRMCRRPSYLLPL